MLRNVLTVNILTFKYEGLTHKKPIRNSLSQHNYRHFEDVRKQANT